MKRRLQMIRRAKIPKITLGYQIMRQIQRINQKNIPPHQTQLKGTPQILHPQRL